MKLFWIVVRVFLGYLLIKMGIDIGEWISAVQGILVGLSALSEFFERLTRAVYAMKEQSGVATE